MMQGGQGVTKSGARSKTKKSRQQKQRRHARQPGFLVSLFSSEALVGGVLRRKRADEPLGPGSTSTVVEHGSAD